jgi:NAD(P)-dependent dehydrogenase (short-subunit alcohol dehydrogenase family)
MRSMITASGSGRLGTVTDIVNAAQFLLGPDAGFLTGTDLLVDGGVAAGVYQKLTARQDGFRWC